MSARTSAIVSGFGAVLMGFMIFSAEEAPSTALATLQYILFAGCLIGLVGALMKMGKEG